MLLPVETRKTTELYFYDLNAKVNYKINGNNRLYLTFYYGNDYYGAVESGLGTFGISWGNGALTLRWNHLFSDKIFSNAKIYASQYDYFLFINKEEDEYWNETISNLSFKYDFTWYPNPRNTVLFGVEVNSHFFNPGNLRLNSPDASFVPYVSENRSRLFAGYLSNEHEIVPKLSVKYGARINLWQTMGEASAILFNSNYESYDTIEAANREVYNSYVNVEPRLSLKYLLGNASSVKASYSRSYQYLQLLSNSTSPFTSLDVWLPSGPNIKPQIADQVALGIYNNTKNQKWEFSLEGYYKKMKNQIGYKDHANMLLNTAVEGELRFGDAWSYGAELTLRKTAGRFSGWLGYTLSKTMQQFDEINGGEAFPAFYDRPHDITFYLLYKTTGRWTISANWAYATGSAITLPTGFYYYQGATLPIYENKNNDRLPDYHRLDLSTNFRLNKNPENRFNHSMTFSLFNAYGRKNPISINFNKIESEEGQFTVPANMITETDIVPTAIHLFGVIPSFNYQFEF